MNLKLQIARLLCFITIIMVISITLRTSFTVNFKNQYISKTHSSNDDNYLKKNASLFSNKLLDFYKDPSEENTFSSDFIHFISSTFSLSFQFSVEQEYAQLNDYHPLIKTIPLWIENRQLII